MTPSGWRLGGGALLALALGALLGAWTLEGPAPSQVSVTTHRPSASRSAPRAAAPAPTAPHVSSQDTAPEVPAADPCLRVLDAASGEPIPGARVAIRTPGSEQVWGRTSDGAGRVDLGALSAGPLEAVACAEGWLRSPFARWEHPAPAPVLRLERGRALLARVRSADGAPLPGDLHLAIQCADERFADAADPLPDASGTFLVRGLPPAEVRLRAQAEGWFGPPVTISLDAAETTLELTLARLELRGEVVGAQESLSATRVEACQGELRCELQLQGATFELALPRPGRWRVRASNAAATSPWVEVEVALGVPGAVQLVLSTPDAVEVQVLGPEGRPFPRARLDVAFGETRRTLTTDAEGRATVRAPAASLVQVAASAPTLAATWEQVQAPSRLVLQLERLVPLRVAAFRDAAGRPRRGTVIFDPLPPDDHEHAARRLPFEVPLDAEGRPQLDGLPDGVWTVSYVDDATPPEADAPRELRAWSTTLDTAALRPETTEARAPGPDLRLEAGEGGVLEGRFSGPGARVQLEQKVEAPGALGLRAATWASAGSFAFRDVPPGTYLVRAYLADGRVLQGEAEVRAGATASLVLTP